MDTKKVGAFLKQLRKENKKCENRMLGIMAVNTILAIAILFMLPLDSIKNVIIFVMVIAMAFISNTVNIIAIAVKKGLRKIRKSTF